MKESDIILLLHYVYIFQIIIVTYIFSCLHWPVKISSKLILCHYWSYFHKRLETKNIACMMVVLVYKNCSTSRQGNKHTQMHPYSTHNYTQTHTQLYRCIHAPIYCGLLPIFAYKIHSQSFSWPRAIVANTCSKCHTVRLNPRLYWCKVMFLTTQLCLHQSTQLTNLQA